MAAPSAVAPTAATPAVPSSAAPTSFASSPGSSPNGQIIPAPGFNAGPGAGVAPQGTSGQVAAGGATPGAVPSAAPNGQQAPSGTPDSAGHGNGGLPGAPSGAQGGGHSPQDLKKTNPYIYKPSFSMAIVGSVAFIVSFFIHVFQLFKHKTWYFGVFTQAVLVSAIGSVARANSVVTLKQTGATGPFIIAMMMENIAPTMTAIGNIFTFTRIVWWVTPNEKRTMKTCVAPPKHISLMWGGLVAISDIAKAVAQNAYKPQDPTGLMIQKIGQIVQFFILAAFFLISFRFMRMSRRWLIHGAVEEKNWRKLGWTVCVSSGILAFRHIFTVVAMDARADPKSFWSLHEWVYWVAEPIPLFIIYSLYNMNFPGEFLPRDYTGFRLKMGELEKAKRDNAWPLNISPPIRSDDQFVHRADDKGFEVTLTELENGDRRRR